MRLASKLTVGKGHVLNCSKKMLKWANQTMDISWFADAPVNDQHGDVDELHADLDQPLSVCR